MHCHKTYRHHEQLIKKFTPMIHKIIKNSIFNYNSSDMCYEKEDIVSECYKHILDCENEYDESRGMSFNSFVYLKLSSRIGNLRNKTLRRNQNGTIPVSDLLGNNETFGSAQRIEDSSSSLDSRMKSYVENLKDGPDSQDTMLDLKLILNRFYKNLEYYDQENRRDSLRIKFVKNTMKELKGSKRHIKELESSIKYRESRAKQLANKIYVFENHFILGKKISEIIVENKNLNYQEVRRHRDNLHKIFNTLIEGDY